MPKSKKSSKKGYQRLLDDSDQDLDVLENDQEQLDGVVDESTPLLSRIALLSDDEDVDPPQDEDLPVGQTDTPKLGFTRQSATKELSDQNRTLATDLSAARRGLEKAEGKGDDKKIKKKQKAVDKEEAKVSAQVGALSQEEQDAVTAAGWPQKATSVKIDGRLKNGPGLSPTEQRAISKLSERDVGRTWLSAAGFFHEDQAVAFLRAGKFYEWLLLEAHTRIQLATIAYDQGIGQTPPSPAYTLGRHFVLRDDSNVIDQVFAETDRDFDIRESFVQTMTQTEMTEDATDAVESGAVIKGDEGKMGVVGGAIRKKVGMAKKTKKDAQQIEDENKAAISILERVFLVLQAGLKIYDKDVGDHVEPSQATDVCRALAHGGRVNIRIPAKKDGEDGKELLRFLGIQDDEGKDSDAVFERGFGTHRMKIEDNGPNGEQGRFIEEGGKGAAIRSAKKSVKPFGESKPVLWGMNVSGGGLGNVDHNGDVILPDGAHGHMFIGFTPPKSDRDGCLQVGMETTAPGAPSMVGYVHDKNSTEATANPESSFGGHKSDKIGDGSPRDVKSSKLVGTKGADMDKDDWKSTNARYVDLNEVPDGHWLQYLQALKSDWLDPMKDQMGEEAATRTLVGPKSAPGADQLLA